jgi:protein gp37
MGDKTIIAWTNHTFNIAWGCTKIDPGCANCYAEAFAVGRQGRDIWGKNKPRRVFGDKHWAEPLKWDRDAAAGKTVSVMGAGHPHLVFTSSMCDVFEDHPTITEERAKLWPLIRATPNLHWQILTKRADRIERCLPKDWGEGYHNVWLGVSIAEAKGCWRADELRTIPAVVRFISYEPALGPIHDTLDLHGIDWVIQGGESGRGYRPMDLEWAWSMRRACEALSVAYFFKQSAAIRTEMGTTLDGQTVRKFPTPRKIARQPRETLFA